LKGLKDFRDKLKRVLLFWRKVWDWNAPEIINYLKEQALIISVQ
jgi:hypothetical protein